MKKCTNCATLNDQQATQCIKCKMHDCLIPCDQPTDISSIAPKKMKCGNCGKDTSIHAKKCIHCRFPVKLLTTKSKENNNKRNFNTGTF